jgi:Leucine-rich repeat (LRR) protein
MELTCEFQHIWGWGFITSPEITQPAVEVTSIRGDHSPGKSNKDVKRIYFHTTVNFIPRRLGDFFPKVTELEIFGRGLKEICREDLSQFRNLTTLWLKNNELKSLPDDLFEDTTKLNYILFADNKIESMSSKLFKPIINNQFRFISFIKNTKINKSYHGQGGTAAWDEFMKIIDAQCKKPEVKELPAQFKSVSISPRAPDQASIDYHPLTLKIIQNPTKFSSIPENFLTSSSSSTTQSATESIETS